MDKVIREGTLRLLITESTCDVILSCSDHRLMAHKLVLSIASPVFRELLQKHSSDSTSVLILPDINGSTMSAILDYIYTGTTAIYSHAVAEFLSIAKFLQIVVDAKNIENIMKTVNYVKKQDNEELIDCTSKDGIPQNNIQDDRPIEMNLSNTKESETKYPQTKPQRKLPDLLPISSKVFRKNIHKKMCNIVVPSPWCPRDNSNLFGDPRVVPLGSPNTNTEVHKRYLEDSNNNFQIKGNIKYSSERQDPVKHHLYLNNLELGIEKPDDGTTNNFESGRIQKYPKLSKSSSSASSFRTNVAGSIETLHNGISEIPKLTTFPFSRHLTSLMPFRSNYLGTSTSYDNLGHLGRDVNKRIPEIPLMSTNEKRILDEPAINTMADAKKTTPLDTFLSGNNKKYSSSPDNTTSSNSLLSFTKLSCTSETPSTTHPSSTLPPSQKTPEKPSITNDKEFHCDSLEISYDVSQNNSKDNSVNSDSSADDKKEDKIVKKKSFRCKDCGKSFSQLRNYKYHRSVHEGTKEFSAKCLECGKTFNDKGYLSSHMKIHRDRKEYACPDCPKRFNQRVAYNMHLRIHTGVKPHECPTCGKSFSRKMLLKQHQRVHTGERPYSCPECGKTFADRSNMSLHARLHTGIKPYACTICPKSFTKKHHLKTHMNFHTGLKPYTCENCGLAFSQSSNMRTHYKKCILRENLSKTESLSSIDNNSS